MSPVARPFGSFGRFGYSYRIDRDAVTLWRSTWLVLPGVALAAVGVWRIVALMGGLSPGSPLRLLIEGLLPLVAGLLLLAAALAPPRRVELTSRGLRWGRRFIAVDRVRSVSADIRSLTVRGKRIEYAALIVTCGDAPERELRLTNASTPDFRVKAIATAMNTIRDRPRGA